MPSHTQSLQFCSVDTDRPVTKLVNIQICAAKNPTSAMFSHLFSFWLRLTKQASKQFSTVPVTLVCRPLICSQQATVSTLLSLWHSDHADWHADNVTSFESNLSCASEEEYWFTERSVYVTRLIVNENSNTLSKTVSVRGGRLGQPGLGTTCTGQGRPTV